jgi:hypothetical protein
MTFTPAGTGDLFRALKPGFLFGPRDERCQLLWPEMLLFETSKRGFSKVGRRSRIGGIACAPEVKE